MRNKELLFFLLGTLISAFLLGFIITDAMYKPNAYVYTYGGDGAFIYYNLIFQSWYGDGLTLKNMNYPFFESIFMTDAQAVIGLFLNFLQSWFPSNYFSSNPIGFMHALQYSMICIGSGISYLVFRRMGIEKRLSLIFGIIMIFLSPMMERLTLGHFGLGFPIVIPLLLYFSLGIIMNENGLKGNVFGLLASLILFGFNNIYWLAIGGGFVGLIGFFHFLIHKASRRRSFINMLAVLGAVSFVFFVLKSSDTALDRIKWQWGYFFNSTTVKGLVCPSGSVLSSICDSTDIPFESRTNLGLWTILSVLFAGCLLIFYPRRVVKELKANCIILSMFLSASVLLMYSSGFVLDSSFIREILGDRIQILTMFKASGRFAWPFYFCMSLIAVYVLNEWIKTCQLGFLFKYGPIFLFAIIGLYECFQYNTFFLALKPKYNNPYTKSKLDLIKEELTDFIDLSEYQAMYTVPIMEGWNDKYRITPNFHCEYNSTRISMATGIPLINSMLSRISLSDASRAIQFASSVPVSKELISYLDKDKNILLVVGQSEKGLTPGEDFLVKNSRLLKSYETYSLHSLNLNQLTNSQHNEIDSLKTRSIENINTYFFKSFDESQKTEHSLDGSPVLHITQDTLIQLKLDTNLVSEKVEISLYLKLTAEKYGIPMVELVNDSMNQRISLDYHDRYDVIDNWLRLRGEFEVKESTNHYELSFSQLNQDFYFDNLLIKPITTDVKLPLAPSSPFDNYNNYLIRKDQ